MMRSLLGWLLLFLTVALCSASEFESDYTYPSDETSLRWLEEVKKLQDHHKQETHQQHTKEKPDLAAEKNRKNVEDESSTEESCSCFYSR